MFKWLAKLCVTDWRKLYPKHMREGFKRYEQAQKSHKKLPDLRQAMNEQLKKEFPK